jgi:hypothetical protein
VIRAVAVRGTRPGCDRARMSARTYRLVLEGELSDPATAAFADVLLTREEGNTILLARDQAEMLGLLQRASDLGITVLSASETGEPRRPT